MGFYCYVYNSLQAHLTAARHARLSFGDGSERRPKFVVWGASQQVLVRLRAGLPCAATVQVPYPSVRVEIIGVSYVTTANLQSC